MNKLDIERKKLENSVTIWFWLFVAVIAGASLLFCGCSSESGTSSGGGTPAEAADSGTGCSEPLQQRLGDASISTGCQLSEYCYPHTYTVDCTATQCVCWIDKGSGKGTSGNFSNDGSMCYLNPVNAFEACSFPHQ